VVNDQLDLTYTNLLGNEADQGTGIRQVRFYQNFYLNWNPTPKFFLVAGGDLGSQTNTDVETGGTAWMYNALTTMRYQFTEHFSLTGRFETFQDPEGFISGLFPTRLDFSGLILTGYTLSTEYKPTSNSYLRLESRILQASNDLNIFESNTSNSRLETTINLGFYFQ
jgi:hypothetical protein